MRKLKHHERKLLKKVSLYEFKKSSNPNELDAMRRYHLQDRDDYLKYNRLVGRITKMAHKLLTLAPDDSVRIELTHSLLTKLFDMGILSTNKGTLQDLADLTVSKVCRRRLGVMVHRLKMAESVKKACEFVEQGHIRIGPRVVRDPAFLVTRRAQDDLSWSVGSSLGKKVLKYRGEYEDEF